LKDIWETLKDKKWILASILICTVAISQANDLHSFYANYLEQRRAEDGLDKIMPGVSILHVKSIFGAPTLENHDRKLNLVEYVFSFKKFYLQVVFDRDNTVQLFSVTSKEPGFNPTVPIIGKNLGQFSFSDVELGDQNVLYSYLSSKHFDYAESRYLGNPGNYRTLYFGFNSSGTRYRKQSALYGNEHLNEKKLENFRKESIPNTFGVGRILGDEKEIIDSFGFGMEYYASRDLPEHNY